MPCHRVQNAPCLPCHALPQYAHVCELLMPSRPLLAHPYHVAFYPERITALNMDAPTERQLDVPTQNRKAFDTCKSLEQKKWETHMMGVIAAGSGMYAYMTRHGLGTGPNLSCTVLYLTLLQLVKDGRSLGAHIHVLLDNTTGDNKNNDVIFFLAWLVETRVCDEASFFCMLVGHTYSEIDRTFNTLIGQLRGVGIWCVSQLLAFTRLFLASHHVRLVEELHCLWDWKGFFKPHVHTRFSGFATSQYGSGILSLLAALLLPPRSPPLIGSPPLALLGMHEFKLRRNDQGKAELIMRKSSKASTWLPIGGGYEVFKTTPCGEPELANAHKDHSWGRATVENNVRQWYRYMSVSQEERVKIENEWHARFEALPEDGDISTLAEDFKLKWAQLPKRVSMPEQPVGGADGGHYYAGGVPNNFT